MNASDRRRDPRVSVCMPVRFRALNNPGAIQQMAESVNLSQFGLCFVTDVPLSIGRPLEMSLRIPHDLITSTSSDVMCVGRVVHVRPDSFQSGLAGIGVHMERFEATTAGGARLVS